MGKALNKRIEFEMCLIKLCSVQIQQKTIDNTEIYDKIKQVDIRQKLKKLQVLSRQ